MTAPLTTAHFDFRQITFQENVNTTIKFPLHQYIREVKLPEYVKQSENAEQHIPIYFFYKICNILFYKMLIQLFAKKQNRIQ